MTYFWSLYLNFNFCAVRSLFPDPLTYVYGKAQRIGETSVVRSCKLHVVHYLIIYQLELWYNTAFSMKCPLERKLSFNRMCCFIDPYLHHIRKFDCSIVKSQGECNVSFMLVLSSEQVCMCVCACVKMLCFVNE